MRSRQCPVSPHGHLRAPLSRILSFTLPETPRCLVFQGCTVFEEKQLQSLLRLWEQTEKSHMVAITAGAARVERTQ